MFFCEFCEVFKDNFFYRTPPVAASGYSVVLGGQSSDHWIM